jgi:hypothetical protein
MSWTKKKLHRCTSKLHSPMIQTLLVGVYIYIYSSAKSEFERIMLTSCWVRMAPGACGKLK